MLEYRCQLGLSYFMTTITLPALKQALPSSHGGNQLSARELEDLCRTPPIDRERLLDQCVNNIDFALQLLDEFAKTSPSRLAGIEAALADHNQVAIASQAHALLGVAAILAADALVETCSHLESAAKNGDWDQARDLIEQLHHQMQRTIDGIPNIQTMS